MIRRSAFCAALAVLLLTGCARPGTALPSTPASGSTPEPVPESAPADGEGAAATPEGTAGVPVPDGLLPAGSAMLHYDEIRPVLHVGVSPFQLNTDYYTMREGGLWGLLRSDGTEVLACEFSEPFFQCEWGDALRWHTSWGDQYTGEDLARWAAQLQAGGDGLLCDGHGGTSDLFIYDTVAGQVRHFSTLDGSTRELDDFAPYTAVYGSWLPCYLGQFGSAEDEWDWTVFSPLQMAYYNADGMPLNGQTYGNAGFFYDQLLAPVEQDGKWAYIDQRGIQMTGMVYSATCGIADKNGLGFTDYSVGSAPLFASPLLNGYAAVCRDGKYGLLDSRGQEYVPCVYGGAVWDGGTLWLQQEDGWHPYAIPGVTKEVPAVLLPGLPPALVQPDRLPAEGERTAYTTTWQDNLKVRTGPGITYSEIDKLPPGTAVEKRGSCRGIANWMLVQYGSRFGWVCSDYLS